MIHDQVFLSYFRVDLYCVSSAFWERNFRVKIAHTYFVLYDRPLICRYRPARLIKAILSNWEWAENNYKMSACEDPLCRAQCAQAREFLRATLEPLILRLRSRMMHVADGFCSQNANKTKTKQKTFPSLQRVFKSVNYWRTIDAFKRRKNLLP